MINFLLILVFCFVFAIFVLQLAFFFEQAKKSAETERRSQFNEESFRRSIAIIEERDEYSVKTTYFYRVREDSPVVAYIVNADGTERLSVATNREKSARLNVYGTDQIKLLGAAIQDQKGILFDRGV